MAIPLSMTAALSLITEGFAEEQRHGVRILLCTGQSCGQRELAERCGCLHPCPWPGPGHTWEKWGWGLSKEQGGFTWGRKGSTEGGNGGPALTWNQASNRDQDSLLRGFQETTTGATKPNSSQEGKRPGSAAMKEMQSILFLNDQRSHDFLKAEETQCC